MMTTVPIVMKKNAAGPDKKKINIMRNEDFSKEAQMRALTFRAIHHSQDDCNDEHNDDNDDAPDNAFRYAAPVRREQS